MAKEIVKQVIITVLTCIVLVLLLLIILYQYIPSNKVMPAKVQAYSLPENVKTELEKSSDDELSNTEELYEISDSELDKQQTRKSYNPGKSDPFADYSYEEKNEIAEKPKGNGDTKDDINSAENYYKSTDVQQDIK